MEVSRGHPDIIIGLIDGPLDFTHPAFQKSRIKSVNDYKMTECKNANDIACTHGTLVTGILIGERGLSAPAICPDCEIILNPIFTQGSDGNCNSKKGILPTATSEELADIIIETIDAGAKIINLSLGLVSPSLVSYSNLRQAYDYALLKGVIVIVAAGNQGNIVFSSLLDHQWPVPVAACDEYGKLDSMSNFGPSIGSRGVMAPGVGIESTSPNGLYSRMSGTSFAAPFVTGTIALLWSIFPTATPARLLYSVTRGASFNRRSVIPPLLNADTAWEQLRNFYT